MKTAAIKILKTISKSTFYIAGSIIGCTLFALILNAVLIHFLVPEMVAIIQKMPAGHMAESGGAGPLAILFLFVLIIVYWPITLMIVCFAIVFPVLYFINAKKYGVQKAIHYIVNDNREFFMEYTVDRLLEHVKKTTGIADKVDATVSKAKILSMLPVYLKKLDTMPRPMRMIFRLFINKIDLGGILTGIIQEQKGGDDAPVNFDMIAQVAREKTADVIQEKLFAPEFKWLAVTFAANIIIFAVLKIVI